MKPRPMNSVLGALRPAQETWRARRAAGALPSAVRAGRLWWLWLALALLVAVLTAVVVAIEVLL